MHYHHGILLYIAVDFGHPQACGGKGPPKSGASGECCVGGPLETQLHGLRESAHGDALETGQMTALPQRATYCTRHASLILYLDDHREPAAFDHLLLQQSVRGLPVTRRLPYNESLSGLGVVPPVSIDLHRYLPLSITISKWPERRCLTARDGGGPFIASHESGHRGTAPFRHESM